MFLANCCCWLLYGAAMRDNFVFCANVPSVPVSLHLILHMYPLASKRVRRQMEATVLASAFVLLFIGAWVGVCVIVEQRKCFDIVRKNSSTIPRNATQA